MQPCLCCTHLTQVHQDKSKVKSRYILGYKKGKLAVHQTFKGHTFFPKKYAGCVVLYQLKDIYLKIS